MLRIGIVGSENSHALAYATLLNVEKVRDDARAVAIWGEEEVRTREVAGKADIPQIVANSRDMLGTVDAVFVENRHGGLHAEHALPFLEAGLPVFVDKPLAVSLEDCGRLIATANRTGAWLASFSSLRTTETTGALAARAAGIGEIRTAQLAGPCDFASVYGGPFFYATHTVEVALRLVGEDVRTVSATRAGTAVTAVLGWENGAHAALTYLGDAKYAFHATLFGTAGMVASEILSNHDGYRTAIGIILDGMTSGKRPFRDDQLVRPVAIVHAIEQSLANGGAAVEVEPMIAQALGAS